MSLLLKALENAAKNREAAEPAAAPETAAVEAKAPAAELSLEPLPQSPRAQGPTRQTYSRGPAATGSGPAVEEERSTATPHQAQSVLRAGAPASRPGVFEWLARRPLVAFSTAAGIFAIGYGTYLYLQLTNPGIFAARPTPKPIAAMNPPPASPPAPSIAPPPPAVPSPTVAESASALPSPAFAPGAAPTPAPPPPTPAAGTAPQTGAPSPAAPATAAAAPGAPAQTAAHPPVAVAAKPAPPAEPAPAAPRVAVAPTPPAAAAPVRPRPAPARAAPSAPLAEGVTAVAAGQVVPVSASLTGAHQALEKGQLDEAERLYRQTLAADPRSIDAMLGLAATLVPQKKTDAASQYYMRVLELDPRNAYAQAGLLNITGRADPVAAEARLKQLIARDPNAFLYFSLGNLYAELGQWAQAQAAYFQAHNLSPDNPDYAFNLAVGLEHLSQPKLALNYYRRALALAQSRGHAQFDAAGVQSRIRSLETLAP